MKKKDVVFGFLAALVLAVFFSPWASRSPDGLERVAQDQGFMEKEEETFSSPLPDYDCGACGTWWTKPGAAAAGVLTTGFLGWGLARLLRKPR